MFAAEAKHWDLDLLRQCDLNRDASGTFVGDLEGTYKNNGKI